jgi:hypothetical protein
MFFGSDQGVGPRILDRNPGGNVVTDAAQLHNCRPPADCRLHANRITLTLLANLFFLRTIPSLQLHGIFRQKPGSTRQLLKRLARLDVLLIDELGYLNLKPERITNGLCRRDERRAGAAHPHVSSPKDNAPAGAAESRQSQEPRIMGIFRSFDGAC